jgi:hypothetical protein
VEVQTIGAVALIAGALLFLAGAFLPVSRIYVTSEVEAKRAIIAARPRMWSVHLGLMGSGAILGALALAIIAASLDVSQARPLGYAAAVAALTGAALWGRHLWLRVVDLEGFVAGISPGWHFFAFCGLMLMALTALGVALLLEGLPTWMGLVLMLGALVLATVIAILRDLPPLLFYLVLLPVGIGLAL